MFVPSGREASTTINVFKRRRHEAVAKQLAKGKPLSVGYCEGCQQYRPAPEHRSKGWRCRDCLTKEGR